MKKHSLNKLIITPKIIFNQIVLKDDFLYKIADIIRVFLRSTWILDDELVLQLPKLLLDEPIQKLVNSLKIPRQHLEAIQKKLNSCMSPFFDKDFTETLIGKMMLEGRVIPKASLQGIKILGSSEEDYKFFKFLIKTTRETEIALSQLQPQFNYIPLLRNIVDKRRNHIKDYYHFELDAEELSADRCIQLGRNPEYGAKIVCSVIMAFLFYLGGFELSLLNVGIFFLMTAFFVKLSNSFFENKPIPQLAYLHEHYLMNQFIIKAFLEEVKKSYSPNEPEVSDVMPTEKNKSMSLVETVSTNDFNFDDNTRKTINKKGSKKSVATKAKEDSVSAKITEINNHLTSYQDNTGKVKQETRWILQNKKEVIYHPIRDMFRIIELLTLDTRKKSLNHIHHMLWNKEEIKEILGKEHEQFYPEIARVGKIGQIVNHDKQGWIYCGNYEEHPWKIKFKEQQIGAFRFFWQEIARTKTEEQSKSEKILYGPAKFSKEH